MKKLTSIFLILCMLFSLAGCGAASKETAEEESVSEEAEEGTGTRTIVDLVGNEVVLPETIETVAIASVWPLAPRVHYGLRHGEAGWPGPGNHPVRRQFRPDEDRSGGGQHFLRLQ